jgi:hypothetical protein
MTPVSTEIKARATLLVETREGSMSIVLAKIPINEASRITGLDESIIRHLISAGVVTGGAELCDLDQIGDVADRLTSARIQRKGYGILGPDAAEKYGFDVGSLYRWQREGWVKLLIERQRSRVFDEGDIAFARALADEIGHVQGKSVFPAKPRSGRPKKPLN